MIPQNFNLPDGCTDTDIDGPEDEKETNLTDNSEEPREDIEN